MGVEPTSDRIAYHSPVLKTGTITGPHALPFIRLAANWSSVERGQVIRAPSSVALLGLFCSSQVRLDRLEVGEFLLGFFV